jgi:hypothetical protein
MRRFGMPRIGVVLAVAAFTAGVAAATANAGPAQSAIIPVSFTGWSACPEAGGEPVQFSGFEHLTYHYVSDPAGGFAEHFEANVQLAGVGLVTGDRYRTVGAASTQGIYPSAGTSIVVMVQHDNYIHTGNPAPGDDFYVTMVLSPGGVYIDQESCR